MYFMFERFVNNRKLLQRHRLLTEKCFKLITCVYVCLYFYRTEEYLVLSYFYVCGYGQMYITTKGRKNFTSREQCNTHHHHITVVCCTTTTTNQHARRRPISSLIIKKERIMRECCGVVQGVSSCFLSVKRRSGGRVFVCVADIIFSSECESSFSDLVLHAQF